MKRRGFVKGLAATVAALEFIPEVAEGLTERLGTMARDLADGNGCGGSSPSNRDWFTSTAAP